MKVSIIIPVYNVSQYIVRCLDSISAQTYPDIECLLIDDCGTDNSINIAEQFMQAYNGPIHFSIIYHHQNQGQGVARNTGIHAAMGDYVFFLDSDDAITPNCISTLVDLAAKYPDADFVQGNTIQGTGLLETHHFLHQVPEYTDEKDELEELILSVTVTTVWNRLIKRSFLTEHSLYFPEGIANCEDQYWIYFLSKVAHAVAFTNRGTYFYYVNANSSTTSLSKPYMQKRVRWHLMTAEAIYADLTKSENRVSRMQRQYFANFLCNCMLQLCLLRSLEPWMTFWKLVYRTYQSNLLNTKYGFLIFLSMMPPLCFLARVNAWRWRLRHYVVSKL